MNITKKIYGLLALLLMGSASVWAQGTGDDPFPDFNYREYTGNMTYRVKVTMNGETITNGFIALFKEGVIRGKAQIGNVSSYPGVTEVFVYGNSQTEQLHVKVFTEGHTIEVASEDFKFELNGNLGTYDNPYTISLPAPIVTTPCTEGWATTCLPFNAEVPAGVEVWNATAIENHELVMNKVTAGTILPANTPVLLKSEGLTSYEWLSKVYYDQASLITISSSLLEGTTKPKDVDAKSVLTLGYSNEGNHELGFWLYTGTTIPANRAYITEFPLGSRGVTFRFEDDIAGISSTDYGMKSCQLIVSAVYTLDGRKVGDATGTDKVKYLQQGLYIINGRKVFIK